MISEKTYGARLLNAQNLVVIIQQFNLTLPQATDSAVEIQSLCNAIVTETATLSNAMLTYKTAVQTRQQIFEAKDNTSVKGMLTYIRKYLDSLYGKDDVKTKEIAKLFKEMRESKAIVIAGTDEANEQKISQSQQSFGSLIAKFKHIVQVLSTYQAYDPPITHLKTPALQTLLTNITTINANVTAALTTLSLTRRNRINLHNDLTQRCLRVKSFILFTYGKDSQEYKSVQKLTF